MAITHRVVLRNPILLLCLIGAAAFTYAFLQGSSGTFTSSNCAVPHPNALEVEYESAAQCAVDSEDWQRLSDISRAALESFPTSESMHNYGAYAELRRQKYAMAQQLLERAMLSGANRTGLVQNNLAWTNLYLLKRYDPTYRTRLLEVTRSHYQSAIAKGRSCERIHTGLFTEYAIAKYTKQRATRRDAVNRYQNLFSAYQPCLKRVTADPDSLAQEWFGLGLLDAKMGELAGVDHPTRHTPWMMQARDLTSVEDVDAFCSQAMPFGSLREKCERDL